MTKPLSTIGSIILRKEKTRLFKKHLYRLGLGKKPLFATESAIAGPERKADLKKGVQRGERPGRTPDGKTRYLFQPVDSSIVMREIGRLRELAFRAVGEEKSSLDTLGIRPFRSERTPMLRTIGTAFGHVK